METIKGSLSKCQVWREFILIFVCVGSRGYQFNRLLIELDNLVNQGKIKSNIFAQIGKSTYTPKHYEHKNFLSIEEFNDYQTKADLIISHGGTGALIGALKKERQVIAVPRLEKFGEHIDDHQTEVAGILSEEGYLRCVLDIDDLFKAIKNSESNPIHKKYKKNSNAVGIIKDFIGSNF